MRVEAFQVVPALPEKLQGLREMAYNLLWTWDEDLRALFRRRDRELWDRTFDLDARAVERIVSPSIESAQQRGRAGWVLRGSGVAPPPLSHAGR